MEKPTIHTVEPCFAWHCMEPAIDGVCQHHRSWDARDREFSPAIFEQRRLQDRLKWVLEDHPELTACGLSLPKNAPDDPVPFKEFVGAYNWLKEFVAMGKGRRDYRCSYGVKHWMEKLTGMYVINGALIAAGYALGLKEKRMRDDIINTCFHLPPRPYRLNE